MNTKNWNMETFINKKGLQIALINGKDVAFPTDWLDDVFDSYSFNPFDSRQLVGYIGNAIVFVSYDIYQIFWRVLKGDETTFRFIEEMAGVKPDYSESPHLITNFERIGKNLVQRFYWED